MISSLHRFRGHRGLRYVYQNGKSTRGPCLILKSVLNSRRNNYRLAVVVSRKVEKTAVGRNRLRRRLYGAVQALEPEIHQPHDIVLTVLNSDLKNMPPDELNVQIYRLLKSAGILHNTPSSKK